MVKQGGSSFRVCGQNLKGVTIQMRATGQYFPVVRFIVLYKVVLTAESVDEILKCDTQMKPFEWCFPLMLFNMLDKVAQIFGLS